MANGSNDYIQISFENMLDCSKTVDSINKELEDLAEIMYGIAEPDAALMDCWSGKAKDGFINGIKEIVEMLIELHGQQDNNSEAMKRIIEYYIENENVIYKKSEEMLSTEDIFGGGE